MVSRTLMMASSKSCGARKPPAVLPLSLVALVRPTPFRIHHSRTRSSPERALSQLPTFSARCSALGPVFDPAELSKHLISLALPGSRGRFARRARGNHTFDRDGERSDRISRLVEVVEQLLCLPADSTLDGSVDRVARSRHGVGSMFDCD